MRRVFFIVRIRLTILFAFAAVPTWAQEHMLTQDQLVSIGPLGWIAPEVEGWQPSADLPLVDPRDSGPGAVLLRRLKIQGRAGALSGVFYENRDRGHSELPKGQFPQLTHLTFGPELRDLDLDYGLAGQIILPAIVIGNSSTALVIRPTQRSQTRRAMTAPNGPERAYLTYANNQVYVYPEHRDYDAADLFPANWPYMITSQGSSGSDQPFLRALGLALAALPDDTLDFITTKKLAAPTLQMILRRSQQGIYKRRDYLSGAAHRVVFDAKRLAPERIVSLANALKPTDVPPLVRLFVQDEDFVDKAGLWGLSEKLFDTPSAVARVWRSNAYRREMFVSAVNTHDPNGRNLTFDWVLLQGNPEKVWIDKLDAAGRQAHIRVDWHDTRRISPNALRTTDRVDIGVFANNGMHDSAPAIISISFPSHQRRQYTPAANGHDRQLASVDYTAAGQGAYFDPLIHWYADWRDEFGYTPDGMLARWKRVLPGGQILWLKREDQPQTRALEYEQQDTEIGPVLVMIDGVEQ